MRSSRVFLTAVLIGSISSTAALAAHVDFNDPRRALGRDDNIRVDAQLGDDTLSPGALLNVTYQIQNLSPVTIAVADKVSDLSFDIDSQTLTLSLGAEVPTGAAMPHLVTIKPGEKRILTGGAFVHVAVPSQRTPWTAVPRYVQIAVTVLRDVTPFVRLIEQQAQAATAPALPNDLFDRWVENSDSVLLNAIPVHWKNDTRRITAESDRPGGGF